MKFRVMGVLIAASIVGVTFASPATANESYRYWSYWITADSAWVLADTGPSDQTPADGAVEGWRFSINGVSSTDLPRYSPDFGSVCADTPAQDGRKRVALIVDPGEASDAPEGETPQGPWAKCVVAEPSATGYDILRAAATVRMQDGLTCDINGYPSTECAAAVPAPATDPQPEPTPSLSMVAAPAPPSDGGPGNPLSFALGAAVIVVIAGAALVLVRRRRT